MFGLEDLFKKDLLMDLVKNCEGLVEVSDEGKYIEAYDEQEGMYLHFHYDIDYDTLFDFGSLKVDKEKFFNVVKNNICKELFLMPDKIYFISNEEELDKLLDEYETHSMDINNMLGINWSCDSVIVINIHQCRIVANEIAGNTKTSFNEIFNEAVWTTLIHELRHMICDLGLIIPDELIPISECEEEKVESYGNSYFWDNIYYEDYECFE